VIDELVVPRDLQDAIERELAAAVTGICSEW